MPTDPRPDRRIRPVIDPATNETLGEGVYRDPELSWDASKLVFAHKGEPNGVTSLYEIGIDGRGLQRLTAGDTFSDYQPAYLPDGRIVFISTRPRALVPCFNSGVGTLHTIHPDGSGLCSISVNNVNEFDPSIMHDGRILYGRWEYVDKTALYMQSLWTMQADGRMEEALFANNLPKPTALLDARAVPGSSHVIASLTPHNGQPVGAIGMVDTDRGKNDLAAVFNFTPEYPVEMDQGLRVGPCDPWPLSETDVLISNNAIGEHGIIELVDRAGNRELVHADPAISCYAPMLVKPRPRPPVAQPATEPQEPGRFLLVDVYQGLTGIPRGTVKRLRIVEETARTSGLPPGGRWWNQAFLVSWQGGYIVKNILGTVPVHEDGSAYFEAPPGRAIYFEALDADGREVQRMRTFVQAAAGVTRSCVGCHEYKKSTPPSPASQPLAHARRAGKARARIVGQRLRRLPEHGPTRLGQVLRPLPRRAGRLWQGDGFLRRLDLGLQHRLRNAAQAPPDGIPELQQRQRPHFANPAAAHDRVGRRAAGGRPPETPGGPAGRARAGPGVDGHELELLRVLGLHALRHVRRDHERQGPAVSSDAPGGLHGVPRRRAHRQRLGELADAGVEPHPARPDGQGRGQPRRRPVPQAEGRRRLSAGGPKRPAARRPVAQPTAALGSQRRSARIAHVDRRSALPGHAADHPPGPGRSLVAAADRHAGR